MKEERYKVPDSIQNNGAQSVKQKAKKSSAGEWNKTQTRHSVSYSKSFI